VSNTISIYLRNWALSLDLWIVFMTAVVLLKKDRNAY